MGILVGTGTTLFLLLADGSLTACHRSRGTADVEPFLTEYVVDGTGGAVIFEVEYFDGRGDVEVGQPPLGWTLVLNLAPSQRARLSIQGRVPAGGSLAAEDGMQKLIGRETCTQAAPHECRIELALPLPQLPVF